MIVVGLDVHKHTHTAVAVDGVGRQLGELTVRATDNGHEELIGWVRQSWPDQRRLWAVEDCRKMTGRLEETLIQQGEQAVRVPPKMTKRMRGTARSRGKSDPIDATAVARAALSEPDLPKVVHDQLAHELKLLVDHREHLIGERTRIINRLRWHLHRFDPDFALPARSLDHPRNLQRVTDLLAAMTSGTEVDLAIELTSDIGKLNHRITALHARITEKTSEHAQTLLDLDGCGHLTAAKILAETAGITRFATDDQYAAYSGTAPIPASSGSTTRHRLSRGGNRQLNAAIHRIVLTQIRLDGPGRAYYQRKQAQGKTKREAIRALKRKITRVIYKTLKDMAAASTSATT